MGLGQLADADQRWRPGGAKAEAVTCLDDGARYLFAIWSAEEHWLVLTIEVREYGERCLFIDSASGRRLSFDWSEVEYWLPVNELNLPVPCM